MGGKRRPGNIAVSGVSLLSRAMGKLDAWPFDFTVVSKPRSKSFFRFASADPFRIIATDGSGGEFVLRDGSPFVVYVSSEGQAGVIAKDVTQLLAIIVAIPYWHDLLKFSSHGSLSEMHRAATRCEIDLQEEDPTINAKRDKAFATIGFIPVDDPIDRLHQAVTSTSPADRVVAADGSLFEPLFGGFSVADNPSWHNAL